MHYVYSTCMDLSCLFSNWAPHSWNPEEAHLPPSSACAIFKYKRPSHTHVLEIPRYFRSPRGRGPAIKKTAGGRLSQQLS